LRRVRDSSREIPTLNPAGARERRQRFLPIAGILCGVLLALAPPLQKPLSWTAVVLGIAFFTPLGFFAFFILSPWMIATGIALYRRQRVAEAGAPA